MIDTALFLVDAVIAQRAGRMAGRYKTEEGKYILNEKDLEHVRFTTEEYLTGLKGVKKITQAEADELIKRGGYELNLDGNGDDNINDNGNLDLDDNVDIDREDVAEEPAAEVTEEEVVTEETEEETITETTEEGKEVTDEYGIE